MVTDEEKKAILEGKPFEEPKPSPPQLNSEILRQKREELEIKKLEAEINKISAPNTNMDMFKEILQLQASNYDKLLALEAQRFQDRLEIERLKITSSGDDSGLMWLEMLKPYLPDIIASLRSQRVADDFHVSSSQTFQGASQPSEVIPTRGTDVEVEKSASTSAQSSETADAEDAPEELEEYKAKIRKGEISEDQAWEDFKRELPDYAKLFTRKQFHERYEKIKGGKE